MSLPATPVASEVARAASVRCLCRWPGAARAPRPPVPLRSVLALALVAACAAGCATAQRAVVGRSITLARSACLGACPDYTVTLRGDGSVEMRGGGAIVRPVGRRTRIRPSAARRVFALADALRFSDLPASIDEVCTGTVSDFPSTRVTVRTGMSGHSVREQECWTLRGAIRDADSVVVRGVLVETDAFYESEEMKAWARANEDLFLRQSLLRQPWFGLHPYGNNKVERLLSAERTLARDSVARRYLGRFYGLAAAVDSATGARQWADAHARRFD